MQDQAEHDELVMTLVESALALPPAERETYLSSVSASNPAVYEEVRSRVEWEERMGGFLCEPVVHRDTAPPEFAAGELVNGRFRIMRTLGRGGMGVVYEAFDEKLDRRIAIKCARGGFQSRLSPEARAALEVSHPNVCKLHELHTAETPQGPIDFLTMEFIAGETLAERIERDGPLPQQEARAIALQICAGLGQAHRQGVIHGDLKTANVILARSADGGVRAVLTDFGLAKLAAASGGVHVMSVQGGTLDYMAPELFNGARASVATDIYALGCLLHVMLTGRTPKASVMEPLPAPWDRIAGKCAAKQPQQRFSSVAEIEAILGRRRPVLKWALVLALTISAVLAGVLWRSLAPIGPPVRLAVLPVAVEGAPIPTAAGLGFDVADRLSGFRRNFTVISPAEAVRNRVDTAARAKAVLGATHVLSTRLNQGDGKVTAVTSIIDSGSGIPVRELRSEYSSDDTGTLVKAVVTSVTAAFHLRGGVPKEVVSGPAYSYYVQGTALLRRDNQSADEATPFFEKAINLDPKSALPYAGLAEAQLQKFDREGNRSWLDLAGKSISKAKAINADCAPVLLASGYWNQQHSSYDAAIADLTRAVDLEPSNAIAWGRLAQVYEKANRPSEAIATYRKSIEAQPDFFGNLLNFGNFYLFRSRYEEAEEQYRRVTAIAPGLMSGHMNLGLALMRQGRFQEAEQSLSKAASLRKSRTLLVNLGALYFQQERFADAARMFEESMASGSGSAVQYANLGDAYRRLGRSNDAAKAYRAASNLAEGDVARDPRNGFSRALLGEIAAELGDARRAELEIDQAMALEPGNAEVLREAAIIYEILRARDKTLKVLALAPASMLREIIHHPDLKELQQDSRFRAMIAEKSRQQ